MVARRVPPRRRRLDQVSRRVQSMHDMPGGSRPAAELDGTQVRRLSDAPFRVHPPAPAVATMLTGRPPYQAGADGPLYVGRTPLPFPVRVAL